MSAIDELRRLLDERGVEYETCTESIGIEHVIWHPNETSRWDWNEEFGAGWISGYQSDVTPQQAVEATLGRGTCKNVGYYIDSTRFECSACGYNGWTRYAAYGEDRVPRYCPNCGRKVASE